jgi:hypothetical protein
VVVVVPAVKELDWLGLEGLLAGALEGLICPFLFGPGLVWFTWVVLDKMVLAPKLSFYPSFLLLKTPALGAVIILLKS